jgi:FlaG/FlaF family flagellin (archaellin)
MRGKERPGAGAAALAGALMIAITVAMLALITSLNTDRLTEGLRSKATAPSRSAMRTKKARGSSVSQPPKINPVTTPVIDQHSI